MKQLFLYLLFLPTIIFCNPTALDSSFNPTGQIPGTLTLPGAGVSYGAQLTAGTIVQPVDQKVVTCGWGSLTSNVYSLFLARYLVNGQLDTVANGGSGFGNNGQGYTNINLYTDSNQTQLINTQAMALTMQPDGKFVVAARGNATNLVVIRFASDGLLDTTFNIAGPNQGYTTIAIPNAVNLNNITSSVAIQSTGNIVVCTQITLGDGSEQIAIFRYTPTGLLDTTFPGGSGPGYFESYVNPSSTSSILYNMVLDLHDNIIIGGAATINNTQQILIARYTANGILDTTFNTIGYATFATPNSFILQGQGGVAVQPNGTIILAATTNVPSTFVNEILMVRYLTNGQQDSSFGSGVGYTYTSVPNSSNLSAAGITFETTGNIVVNGSITLSGTNFTSPIIFRYTNNGSLDTNFTSSGYIATNTGYAGQFLGAPTQAGGKLIVSGSNNNALLLARYLEGTQTEQVIPAITNYGYNPAFTSEFLYHDFYATIITNLTARTATIAAINTILSNYNASYENQPNFNYIAYLYLIEPQLVTTQATLIATYPTSAAQINHFFAYINDRIANLIAS